MTKQDPMNRKKGRIGELKFRLLLENVVNLSIEFENESLFSLKRNAELSLLPVQISQDVDCGVDMDVELLDRSKPTGIHFFVQVKNTSRSPSFSESERIYLLTQSRYRPGIIARLDRNNDWYFASLRDVFSIESTFLLGASGKTIPVKLWHPISKDNLTAYLEKLLNQEKDSLIEIDKQMQLHDINKLAGVVESLLCNNTDISKEYCSNSYTPHMIYAKGDKQFAIFCPSHISSLPLIMSQPGRMIEPPNSLSHALRQCIEHQHSSAVIIIGDETQDGSIEHIKEAYGASYNFEIIQHFSTNILDGKKIDLIRSFISKTLDVSL